MTRKIHLLSYKRASLYPSFLCVESTACIHTHARGLAGERAGVGSPAFESGLLHGLERKENKLKQSMERKKIREIRIDKVSILFSKSERILEITKKSP